MNNEPQDALLMNELAMGRDRALEELMRRWEAPLRCFIDRMCGSAGCEDVYQEVWTRIYLYRKKYDAQRPFRPFLFTVAVNACRSALTRARRFWQSGELEEAARNVPAGDCDPAAELISAEQRNDLHVAIRRLPEMQRAVVLLYLLCDSDYARIAEILGRSQGTIRSQMHHALQGLRSHLSRFSGAPKGSVPAPAGPARHER